MSPKISTKRDKHILGQEGFTILELMVAMTVLSVVLLLATMSILGVGKLYHKGQVSSTTQDTTRNIISEVSHQIQFNGETPNLKNMSPGNTCPSSMWCASVGGARIYAYCIGTARYSFVLNRQLSTSVVDTTHSRHVLWEDTLPNDVANCTPLNVLAAQPDHASTGAIAGIPGSGKELVLANMELIGFGIIEDSATEAYQVTLHVGYGSDDLLTAPTGSDPVLHRLCKSGVGDQFCSVSEVSTSITRRLR